MLDYYAKADYKKDWERGETVCTIFTRMLKQKGLKIDDIT